jgi:hypothetical protein
MVGYGDKTCLCFLLRVVAVCPSFSVSRCPQEVPSHASGLLRKAIGEGERPGRSPKRSLGQ